MIQVVEKIGACGCLLCLVLAGCSGPTPFSKGKGSPYGSQAALPSMLAADQPIDPATLAQSGQSRRNPLTAVGDAGNAFLTAVTPRPQTVPLNDPVRLSNEPTEVDSSLYYHAARLYESQNKIGQAVTQYQQALEVNPNDNTARIGLARLYDRQADLARAEQLYAQAAQIDPQNAIALNDLGLCYARQRKLDAAYAALLRASELEPSNQRYRNNLATVLVELGRGDEAYQMMSQVHAPAVAHYNTAFLMARRGIIAPAVQHLSLALQADPSFQPARVLMQQLQGGSTTQSQASTETAMVRRLPPV